MSCFQSIFIDIFKTICFPNRTLAVKTAVEFKAKLSSEFNGEEHETSIIEITEYCRQIADRKSLLTILPLEDYDETSKGSCNVEETVLGALLKGI